MSILSNRLGKSGSDRIRYVSIADTSKQPGSTNIHNTVIKEMQYLNPNDPSCHVGRYITAASLLDNTNIKPLNINRIYNILKCIRTINTREVMAMTELSKRQAQKYVRAVKFILPYIAPLV
jgi:hypothetical protein